MIRNNKKHSYYKINRDIKSPTVRITGEGIESRVVTIHYALELSASRKEDLIEIVSKANPPVCKIIEFQKFLYEKKLKEKQMKKIQKQKTSKIKELRFTYNTGEHDFNFKLKHAVGFLTKGDKVKAYVRFMGREIQFFDQGKLLLLNFVDKLSEYGKIEQMPVLNNKRLSVVIVPK